MLRFHLSLTLIVSLFCGFISAQNLNRTYTPVIIGYNESPTSASFDFGFVPMQATVQHTFRLRNGGSEELHIDQVKPGCGCTKAPLEKDILAPGDSTDITITFSTGLRIGQTSKRTKVFTDKTKFHNKLDIESYILQDPDSTRPLVISPSSMTMPPSTSGDSTVTVTLTNVGDTPVSITPVSAPGDLLTILLPDAISPGGSKQLMITFAGEAPRTELKTSITIECNDPDSTRFTIPIIYDPETSQTQSSR